MADFQDYNQIACEANVLGVAPATFDDNCNLQLSDVVAIATNFSTTKIGDDWEDATTVQAAISAGTLVVIKKGVSGGLPTANDNTIDTSGLSGHPDNIVIDRTRTQQVNLPDEIDNEEFFDAIDENANAISEYAFVTKEGTLHVPDSSPSVTTAQVDQNGLRRRQLNVSWKGKKAPRKFRAPGTIFGNQ